MSQKEGLSGSVSLSVSESAFAAGIFDTDADTDPEGCGGSPRFAGQAKATPSTRGRFLPRTLVLRGLRVELLLFTLSELLCRYTGVVIGVPVSATRCSWTWQRRMWGTGRGSRGAFPTVLSGSFFWISLFLLTGSDPQARIGKAGVVGHQVAPIQALAQGGI